MNLTSLDASINSGVSRPVTNQNLARGSTPPNFLDPLAVSRETSGAFAGEVLGTPHLRSLNLSGRTVVSDIGPLRGLTELQTLRLTDTNVDPMGANTLEVLSDLPNLETLSLPVQGLVKDQDLAFNEGDLVVIPYSPVSSPLLLDGVDDHVDLGAALPLKSLSNLFTVSAWVNPKTVTGVDRIISSKNGSGWGVGLNNSRPRFTFYGVVDYDLTSTSIPVNTWTQLTVTVDAGNVAEFFVNGVSVGRVNGTSAGSTQSLGFAIGEGNSGSERFDGKIMNVAVWNRVLSANEITQVKQTEPSAVPTNLIGFWPLSGDANDVSGSGLNGTLQNGAKFGQDLTAPPTTHSPWEVRDQSGNVLASGSASPIQFVANDDGVVIASQGDIRFPIVIKNLAPTIARTPDLVGANSGKGVNEGQTIKLGTPVVSTNGLTEWWFDGTFGDSNINPIAATNSNSFLAMKPGAITTLDRSLSFDGNTINIRSGGVTGTDGIGALWLGTVTIGEQGSGAPLVAGNVSFGTRTDDGSTFWVDSNQNGVFESTERVVQNLGSHGNEDRVGTVNLPAGKYNIAMGYYEGNGPEFAEARFAQGTFNNSSFSSMTIIDPSSPTQRGLWSPLSNARIEIPILVGSGTTFVEVDRLVVNEPSVVDAQQMVPRLTVSDDRGRTSDLTQAALTFSNDIVRIPGEALNGVEDFTITFWLSTTSSATQTIVSGTNQAGGQELAIVLVNDHTMRFTVQGVSTDFDLGSSVADGAFRFFVLSRKFQSSGAIVEIFGANRAGDFEMTARRNVVSSFAPLSIDTNGLVVGQQLVGPGPAFSNSGSNPLQGTLDELTFWNRRLSPDEESNVLNNLIVKSSENLIGYWPFNEGFGSVAHDQSVQNHDGLIGHVDDEHDIGVSGRFIQVQNRGTNQRELHVAEIEAFLFGVNPSNTLDNANDVALASKGGSFESAVFSILNHGQGSTLVDGLPQGGANVFSIIGVGATMVIDLGQTRELGAIRVWQRQDSCCDARLSDFDVSILADNGAGLPGREVFRESIFGTTPSGSFSRVDPRVHVGIVAERNPTWTSRVPDGFATAFVVPDDGTYRMTLSVGDGDGGEASTQRTFRANNLAPQAPNIGPDRNVTVGDEVDFSASNVSDVAADNISFVWEVTSVTGEVVSDSTEPNLTFTPLYSGVYNVRLTVIDSDEPTNSTTRSTTSTTSVFVKPVATIVNATSTADQVGETIALTAAFSSPLPPAENRLGESSTVTRSFRWNVSAPDGGGVLGLGETVSFVPTVAGRYTITLSIADTIRWQETNGQITNIRSKIVGSTTVTKEIDIGAADRISIVKDTSRDIEEGSTITFAPGHLPNLPNLPDGATSTRSFQWSAFSGINDLVTGNGETFQFTPDHSGTFFVVLEVTDSFDGISLTRDGELVMSVGELPMLLNTTSSLAVVEATPLTLTGKATVADRFTIDWGDGSSVQQGAINNGAFSPSHTFTDNGEFTATVTISDSTAPGQAVTSRVAIHVLNQAPNAIGSTRTITEDSVLTISAANLIGTSSDLAGSSDALSLTTVDEVSELGAVIRRNTDGSFAYDPTNATNLNRLAAGKTAVDHFAFVIGDDDGGNSVATFTVTVSGVNDVPVTLADRASTAEETLVSIAAITNDQDVDGTLVPGSVTIKSNPGHGTASIDPNTGRVRYMPALDFTGRDSFTYTVRDNSGGTSPETTVSIDVTPANDAPTDIKLLTNSLVENQAGVPIGELVAIDVDSVATHDLIVTDERFEVVAIDDAKLALKLKDGVSLDFESTPTISLEVTANDSAGVSITKTITVTVTNVNEPPTSVQLLNDSVDRTVVGATIGRLLVADPDANDAKSFAVSDSRLEVVNGELRVKAGQSLSSELSATIAVDITVTDSGTPPLSVTDQVVIHLIDSTQSSGGDGNAAPFEILLDSNRVTENAAGAIVGNLSARDPNTGDTHTFTVSDSRFEVNGTQLKLKAGQSLNFEAANQVLVTVTATDSGTPRRALTQQVTINVTDVNEAPTGIFSIVENAEGEVLATLRVEDPDTGDLFVYELSDPRFEVVNQQLKLKDDQHLDFEESARVDLQVTAIDATRSDLRTTTSFVVNVSNANDPPNDIRLESPVAKEKVAGVSFGRILVSDQDSADTHTISVNDPRFEIVNGNLKLKDSESLDLANGNVVNVSIVARDNGTPAGTLTKSVSITVVPNTAVWQNQTHPLDSTADGFVTAIDVLVIFNELNEPEFADNGRLPPVFPNNNPRASFLDVNGDQFVSAFDALLVINDINTNGAHAAEGERESQIVTSLARRLEMDLQRWAGFVQGEQHIDRFHAESTVTPASSVNSAETDVEALVLSQTQSPSITSTADAMDEWSARDLNDHATEWESLLDDIALGHDDSRRGGE